MKLRLNLIKIIIYFCKNRKNRVFLKKIIMKVFLCIRNFKKISRNIGNC